MALEARRFQIDVDDGRLAGLRFGAPGAAPLLFAHANGFCASAYRRMLEAIGDRFDVFAIDLRGHGRTEINVDPKQIRSFEPYAADVGKAIDGMNAKFGVGGQWRLAGHSLGAVAATLCASRRPGIDALRLIEPVATPAAVSRFAATPFWPPISRRMPLVRAALGRRALWPDRDAARQAYARKAFFATWADGVLDDYLIDGLRPAHDGVRLACAPALEAANFAAQAHDFWTAARQIGSRGRALGVADASSTLVLGAAQRLRRIGWRVTLAATGTHLLPFERPDAAAAFLAS